MAIEKVACEMEGCDVVSIPDPKLMYPKFIDGKQRWFCCPKHFVRWEDARQKQLELSQDTVQIC